MRAIEHASRVTGWYENLSADEVPPSWMWPHEQQLGEWFEGVEARRKEKFGGSSSSSQSLEEVPLMENELLEQRR